MRPVWVKLKSIAPAAMQAEGLLGA